MEFELNCYQAVLIQEDWERYINLIHHSTFDKWILSGDLPDPNDVLMCPWKPEEPITVPHEWLDTDGKRHVVLLRYF